MKNSTKKTVDLRSPAKQLEEEAEAQKTATQHRAEEETTTENTAAENTAAEPTTAPKNGAALDLQGVLP